jgi:hypothetical protein
MDKKKKIKLKMSSIKLSERQTFRIKKQKSKEKPVFGNQLLGRNNDVN